MGNCELCGALEAPFTNLIEGATMKVCRRCSSTGQIIDEEQPARKSTFHQARAPEPEDATMLDIRHDIAQVFLTERNKRRMTQERFSQFLNIKQSMLASFESGAHKPSLGLAQKLEKILKVPLIEAVSTKSEFELSKEPSTGGLTLGHFIKKKKA